MLTFTITTDSEGSVPSMIRLSSATNDVHEVEVAHIWMAIKDGRFETQAKQMLERFCAKRGMDATKVLQVKLPGGRPLPSAAPEHADARVTAAAEVTRPA